MMVVGRKTKISNNSPQGGLTYHGDASKKAPNEPVSFRPKTLKVFEPEIEHSNTEIAGSMASSGITGGRLSPSKLFINTKNE